MKIIDPYGFIKRTSPVFSEFKDQRDGKLYRTVIINGIEWFRDNLDYDIDSEVGGIGFNFLDIPPFSIKPSEYGCGRIYSFAGAIDSCPEGWEIPKRDEWIDLFKSITLKNPNEWKDVEKSMIYHTLTGKNSILKLMKCGYNTDLKYPAINASGGSGAYLTSTPGSMDNGGAVFYFSERDLCKESVGYGRYSVRPVRKVANN